MSFKNVTEKLQFIDSTIPALIETARPLGDDLFPLQVGARLFKRLASEKCAPREEAHRELDRAYDAAEHNHRHS
jgi:hypothetical protein